MRYPVRKVHITQGWGLNPDRYAWLGLLGHNGIDLRVYDDNGIKASKGKLLAPHSGIIIEARFDPDGYGWYYKIENDKEGSILGHNTELFLKVGDTVEEGQVIGITGNTGWSTAPHIHWGYYLKPRDRSNGYGGTINQVPLLEKEIMIDENTMIITKADFEKIRDNSEKWDEVVKYLEVQSDPATTPFDKIRSVIAGFKSRLTDLAKKLTVAQAGVENKDEQISRIKAQLLDEAKLAKDQYDKLNQARIITETQLDSLQGRVKALQGQVDIFAKAKGQAIEDKATVEAELKETQDKYKTLLSEHTATLTWSQRVQVLLTGKLV